MSKNRIVRFISIAIGGTSIICFICACIFHNIPSYEQDFLMGIESLLHWSMVYYLPLFPFVSGILAILITNRVEAFEITAINFLLTIVFTIFAYYSQILSTSWIFLSIASGVIMLGTIYDRYFLTKDISK